MFVQLVFFVIDIMKQRIICLFFVLLWMLIGVCLGIVLKLGRPKSLYDWWTNRRRMHVKRRSLMLWDMVMAIVWVLWNERNNRIFNHKALSVYELIDSILHFVEFWAGHMPLPLKCKVDTTIITYGRKKCRESSDRLRVGDSSNCGAIYLLMKVVFYLDSMMGGMLRSVFRWSTLLKFWWRCCFFFVLDFWNLCCFLGTMFLDSCCVLI